MSESCLKQDNITINDFNQSALIQAHGVITGIKVLKKGKGAIATKKKGSSPFGKDWERYLRPHDRKQLWSSERIAVKKSTRSEVRSKCLSLLTMHFTVPCSNLMFSSRKI